MNVPTIKMGRLQAADLYDEYRHALENRAATEEDQTILLGYKALAEGKQLLNLNDVMRASPVDQFGRPCFAVARGHWGWCFHNQQNSWRGSNKAVFAPDARRLGMDNRGSGNVIVPRTFMPAGWKVAGTVRALVPLIPVTIRPKGDLSKYHILFEARWEPVAPADPILLRRLTGPLYVILAAWDLTELERAVLAGRLETAHG